MEFEKRKLPPDFLSDTFTETILFIFCECFYFDKMIWEFEIVFGLI